MTIYGWDASDFDHDRGMRPTHIRRAADQGIRFFTHKITEGTHVTHQHAGNKLTAARDAGIPFLGAYIVVRSGPSIRAQVDHAIAQIDRQAPWWREHPGWFWQVDLERWPYDSVEPERGVQMCAELERRGRWQAILYAPRWAYGHSIPGEDPLWASHYGSNNTGDFRQLYPGDDSSRWAAYSGRTPAILQYGSRATIGGQRTCDANAFRGTVADFARLINAEEDDMPLTKDDVMTIWRTDGVIRAPGGPDTDPEKNPYWTAESFIQSIRWHAFRAREETIKVRGMVASLVGQDVEAEVRTAIREEFGGLTDAAVAAVRAAVPEANQDTAEAALRAVLGSLDEDEGGV